MKFITEEDLRDLYRKEPFTTYEMEPGARLTPGARQFLADRGIKMSDNGQCANKNTANAKQLPALTERKSTWKKKQFLCRMKSMEALFLLTAEELLSRDVLLAQSVINLGKQFSRIRNNVESKGSVETLCCQECTGINLENFSLNLDDCFEITEFHIQLEKGREIIILHRMRCALREIELVVLELYEDSDNENELSKDVIEKVNQIINSLSQMICSFFGGKKCQRKS